MSDYEKDVEEATASMKLEELNRKTLEKAARQAALLAFLRDHPDFKKFYDLYEAVGRY